MKHIPKIKQDLMNILIVIVNIAKFIFSIE